MNIHEYFIYHFYYVENIAKSQCCDQQSVLLQQLWLQFKTDSFKGHSF